MFHSELMTAVYVVAGGGVLLAGALSLPALTDGTGSVSATQAHFQQTATREMSYCRSNGMPVNCVCFGHKSGHILSEPSSRVHGLQYANRERIARDQARSSC